MRTFADLPTPCLLLDGDRLRSNADRMKVRAREAGVRLRPNMKTAKSIDVAECVLVEPCISVSTVAEAEYFFDHGITDILYSVVLAPNKLDRVAAMRARGADVQVLVDSPEMAVIAAGRGLPTWIEIDSDGRRSGLAADHRDVVETATVLDGILRGVLTHHGGSYAAHTEAERTAAAMVERDAVLEAADRIRAAGVRCDGVSVGSTPTACTGIDLTGITEFRPGVYMFMDLYQAGIGVCDVDDIAVSVLTSVIGHRPDGVIIDAGALALSADRSTSHLPVDLGYGQACTLEGEPIDGLTVEAVTQEHGIARSARPEDYPIGTLLRILPNHACITAAGHAGYHVVEGNTVQAYWNRVGGW